MTEQELRDEFDMVLKFLDGHCGCDPDVGYFCENCNMFNSVKLFQETIKAKDAEIEKLKSTFAGYENFKENERQLKAITEARDLIACLMEKGQ